MGPYCTRRTLAAAVCTAALLAPTVGTPVHAGRGPGAQSANAGDGPAPTSATVPVGPTSTGPPNEGTVRIVVAGDILPHMPVIRAACGRSVDRDAACDFERLLAPTEEIVRSADLAICHLEVPMAPEGRPVSGFPTFGAPLQLAEGIARTGWDRCSTASNHSIDKGAAGVDATLDALDANGVGHSGTARSFVESTTTPLFEVNGVRVAHLSYTYGLNGLRLPKGEPWRVNLMNTSKILNDAAQARIEGAELVLVSLHWGQEYRRLPTPQQRVVARELTASGSVDLVIGHHAHVVQPVESINGHWVLFGLGNHLSAQVASRKRPVGTQDGLMVSVTFTRQPDGTMSAVTPELHPTWVHPTSRVVHVVDDALADESLSDRARTVLNASRRRTLAAAAPVD